MKVAIFRMYNERGHLLPAFALAQKLEATGAFRAVFVAASRFEDEIRGRGFGFEPEFNFEDPAAHAASRSAMRHPSFWFRKAYALSGLKHDLALEFLAFSQSLVAKYRPAIAFIDELHTHYVIAWHREEFPVITVSTYLLSYRERHLPPPNTDAFPANGFVDQLRLAAQWRSIFLQRWARVVRGAWSTPGSDYFYGALSKHAGYPRATRLTGDKYYWVDDRRVDKLVLCPPFFDFPRSPASNVFFVDSCVDTTRIRGAIEPTRFGNSNPLIYCAFGTQSHKDAETCAAFLGRLVRACSHMPDVNLLVASAGLVPHDLPDPLPPNVRICDEVSQLDVLGAASLMITHGGLGSVKECIHRGVPLLVYPLNLDVDQPGNAARVAFHRIGLRGDVRTDSTPDIVARIREALSNRSYRHNVTAMQRQLHEWDAGEPFLRFVKSRLPDVLDDRPNPRSHLNGAPAVSKPN